MASPDLTSPHSTPPHLTTTTTSTSSYPSTPLNPTHSLSPNPTHSLTPSLPHSSPTPSPPHPPPQLPHDMSLSRRSPLRVFSFSFFAHIHRRLQSTSTTNTPLRILFCGSDHFSATSLKALYGEHTVGRDVIESIDVLCKTDKRAGRGLRTLREGVPLTHSLIHSPRL